MNDQALFASTVPVLTHYLCQLEHVLSLVEVCSCDVLLLRLERQAFCTQEHVDCAIGFVPRVIHPLIVTSYRPESSATESLNADPFDEWIVFGDLLDVPQSMSTEAHLPYLQKKLVLARHWLESIDSRQFDGAEQRTVAHTAGTADLTQSASDYVTLFALPNFFFHWVSAYCLLKQGGVDLGKSDFDGLHQYAPGFHFEN